jgi:hypothetical protein
MRRAAVVLLAWGAWLGLLTALQLPFAAVGGPFGLHPIEPLMLGSAAAGCLAAGALLWLADAARRLGSGERPRTIAESSFATATLIAGLALALLGAGFGLWLILIGAGLAALGCGGLLREARARRRALKGIGPRGGGAR